MAKNKQTGLTITRNGDTFKLDWKLGEKAYTKQYIHVLGRDQNNVSIYPVYPHDWPNGNIGGSVVTQSINIYKNDWYPKTANYLKALEFWLTGDDSGLAEKRLNFAVTPAPTVKAVPSDSLGNACTFTWNVTTDDTGNQIFTDIEYQSMLVANSTETDGSKLNWSTSQVGWIAGTGTADNSRTISEANTNIATGSHTRWFRARSRGPFGASAWRYAKRVYAVPNAPQITSTKTTKIASGYQVLVNWNSPANSAYPAETNTLEYLVTTPAEDLTVPASAQWTEAQVVNRVTQANSGLVIYDSELDTDEVLFVRVRATHVLSENASAPVLAQVGYLAPPTITDIQTQDTTFRATLTANNASQVPGSFLAILYRTASEPNKSSIVGVIPAGETTTTIQLPDWSHETGFAFGVYAVVGTYERIQRADGLSSYKVVSRMRSRGEVWSGGTVPQAPSFIDVARAQNVGDVLVSWDWTWTEATSSIISWSDNPDAWGSTDEPNEYEVSNISAAQWIVAGLETGRTWYFRVRLKKEGESVVYGPWSEMVEIDLSSAPTIPVLTLSESIITEGGSVTGYWAYTSTDGTAQAYAEICECTITSSGIEYGDKIAETRTAQSITIYAEDVGWQEGETHYLAVRVVSGSGRISEGWSDPVPVTIARPVFISGFTSSLVNNELKVIPLWVRFTATETVDATLIIERSQDYSIVRPDNSSFTAFKGETVYAETYTGIVTGSAYSTLYVMKENLLGSLDDGASYNLILTVQDGYGQTDEIIKEFTVNWADKALEPAAEVEIVGNEAQVILTASVIQDGAYYDVYRLSADTPELVYSGASMMETIVDPYPAINGGYRVVYRTAAGSYITADSTLAFLDIDSGFTSRYALIDFNGETIEMFYDSSQSNEWEKDFVETKYLGGSIQGDWNRGVNRRSSFNVSFVTFEDQSKIEQMRRLATYEGLCHIRTLDGSSFDCDIQVSEDRDYGGDYVRASFSLTITRVEQEGYQGYVLE